MNVHLLKNSPHLRGILSSKAVGEPPLLLSVSALSAVQVWSSIGVMWRETATSNFTCMHPGLSLVIDYNVMAVCLCLRRRR